MDLAFLGGTGTVTGSKYLLRDAGTTVLVDCGQTKRSAEKILTAFEAAAKKAGISCDSGIVVSEHPYEAIIKTAAVAAPAPYCVGLPRAAGPARHRCRAVRGDLRARAYR